MAKQEKQKDPQETPQDVQETPEAPKVDQETPEAPEAPEKPEEKPEPEEGEEVDEDDDKRETFPRSYVEKLRRESAGHRDKAKRADDYAAALWETRVAASGRLADPTDLPMPEGADPLDADAVETAVADLLARKPHLAARVPRGDVGQGFTAEPAGFSLLGALRGNA